MNFILAETERLYLRAWCIEDKAAFASMNADVELMKFFPNTLNKSESDALYARINKHFLEHNWGLWALELKEEGDFIGFTGLSHVPFDADFCPAVEIAWRIARPFWRQGFAYEAATAALDLGFSDINLERVVSFTSLQNLPSQALMQKLKMKRLKDFNHPVLAETHPLSRHVLYAIKK